MKESLYMQAIRKGWHFTWNNKIVWIFGLFAAFLGQFGIVEFLGKIGFTTGDLQSYFGSFISIRGGMDGFVALISHSFSSGLLTFLLIALLFSLFALFAFISVTSQGLLIHTSAESVGRKKKLNILKAWNVSSANFWRLLFINFFKKLIMAVFVIVVSLSAYSALINPTTVNSLLFLLIFLLVSFAGVVLSFMVVYSAAYVIVEKYSFYEAVEAAWNLFLGHWLVSIEVGLILLIFNLFLVAVIVLGFALLILPAILLWFVVILVGVGQAGLVAGLIAGLIFFTMYLMIIAGAFNVFTTYVWTHLFMKMHKVGVKSRVLHYLSHKKR